MAMPASRTSCSPTPRPACISPTPKPASPRWSPQSEPWSRASHRNTRLARDALLLGADDCGGGDDVDRTAPTREHGDGPELVLDDRRELDRQRMHTEPDPQRAPGVWRRTVTGGPPLNPEDTFTVEHPG